MPRETFEPVEWMHEHTKEIVTATREKIPIDLPRFTDDEFKAAKAKHVAKHGYEVALPSIGDIIRLGTPPEPTKEELRRWRAKDRTYLGDRRYNEIGEIVKGKRERFKRMLASPVPTWMNNVASVMTFFDDVNDVLGTAGVVLRTVAKFFPKFAARFFLGPAGWLFLAADLFGVMLNLMTLPLRCGGYKKTIEAVSGANPFSKQSRVARARKLKRIMPSKGEWIEGLQTTNELWGVGLSLGPIMGAAYDIAFGLYREVKGEKVTWFKPPPLPRNHELWSFKSTRAAQAMGLAEDEFSEEDHLRVFLAMALAARLLRPYFKEWNPLDEVQGLQHILIPAPGGTYPSTQMVLEDQGIMPGERIGWPFLEKQYAGPEEMWDTYNAKASKSAMDYFQRNKKNKIGLTAAQNAEDFGKNMLANAEGDRQVVKQYDPEVQKFIEWCIRACGWYVMGDLGTGGIPVHYDRGMRSGDFILMWS